MNRSVPTSTMQRVIYLRVEQPNLSTPDIARIAGVSLSAAYKILKGRPFTRSKRRPWTAGESAVLAGLYPASVWSEILAALPGRSQATIARMASQLKLRRSHDAARPNSRFVHPLFHQLRQERHRRRLTRPQLSEIAGFHHNQILNWETGKTQPSLLAVEAWANALGMELTLAGTADRRGVCMGMAA